MICQIFLLSIISILSVPVTTRPLTATVSQTGQGVNAGSPRWKYNFKKEDKVLKITVSTQAIREDEVMSGGVCHMSYYKGGKVVANVQITLKVPIKSNVTDTQEFTVDHPDVDQVKGIKMDWIVRPLGRQTSYEQRSREGSIAPNKD
jgi:hypothetical protein